MGRRNAREEVLAKHLGSVFAEHAEVASALGLPRAGEPADLRRRDDELALIERGLGLLLPATWGVRPSAGRGVPEAEETRVLADIRSTAAVLAVRLQQREEPASAADRLDLATALALHGYADAALRSRPDPDAGNPVPSVRRSAVDAAVSKHLRVVRARMRALELILTGRAPLIVPTLDEQARFQAELREDDLLERGFTDLLPAIWPVTGTSERRVGLVQEARVLVQLRAAAANIALGAEPGERHEDRRRMAGALFRCAHRALTHFDFDENEMLPGGSLRYERIVAYAMFGQRWGSI
jgi:hypothetical protein